MQVAQPEGDGSFALCSDGVQRERLDMRLVGPQPAGTWVLNFQGAARRVLDAQEAAQIADALRALAAAMRGEQAAGFDALFADLAGREPQLPPHLRPPA